jgi:hypothetical protein
MELPEGIDRFTLPQIADYVRVHILRDWGGYWLDTDTIMLGDELPDVTILGNPNARTNTIGFLHADQPHSDMFEYWAEYQDSVVANPERGKHWSSLGNDFTDPYLANYKDIRIGLITTHWPETYMIPGNAHRRVKYANFYFCEKYTLKDLLPTKFLMLHNSWTPEWYKMLTRAEVLEQDCTLSNIFREVL